MKQVYRSENEFEAQMIMNLLEQSGIEAHLSGQDLQGLGLSAQPIQIFVLEEDFEEARRIVESGYSEIELEEFEESDSEEYGESDDFTTNSPISNDSSRFIRPEELHSSPKPVQYATDGTDWRSIVVAFLVGLAIIAGGFWGTCMPQ
ncbi:MAG: DUF2007 domain-containing protein [Leptospiraceae bacterium]|nr:DUF2007 domain-containing protein [Leptospiraceae bacterium]